MPWPGRKIKPDSPNHTNNREISLKPPKDKGGDVKTAENARKGGLRAIGKSVRRAELQQWERELSKWVRENLPSRCEMCGITNYLSKAHSKKRRFIYTREDYFEVAILCTKPFYQINRHGETETIYGCHGIVERLTGDEMHARIRAIIAKREVI